VLLNEVQDVSLRRGRRRFITISSDKSFASIQHLVAPFIFVIKLFDKKDVREDLVHEYFP